MLSALISPSQNWTAKQQFDLTEDKAEEEHNLRPNRFTPLTKPRTITRLGEAEDYCDSVYFDAAQSVQEFNLCDDIVFNIDTLAPLRVKKFKNLEAFPYVFETSKDVLQWAFALLSESPLGLALIQEAQESGWQFCLNDLGTNGFHMDAVDQVIELDDYHLSASELGRSSFYRYALCNVLATALRDIWHENRVGAFEENFNPEATLQLERARAADADSVAVFIGWELRAAGHQDLWRHIITSDEGDMAQVMINILGRYPTAAYNGMALAHLFRQWYADEARVDALDHDTLERMDMALTYNKDTKFGEKSAQAEDFEALAALPDGTYYLKELGETVLRDPFFAGLHDPINQAHLFQIIYDNKVTFVQGIPFRDAQLARKFLNAD